MKLKNILIAVTDIEKSKEFYHSLFGLDVVLAREGNVILTEGLVLQDVSLWKDEISRDVIFQNHSAELYFEDKEIEKFIEKLNNYPEPPDYVTPFTELPWGQKLVRFYDPDGNLIEVRTPA